MSSSEDTHSLMPLPAHLEWGEGSLDFDGRFRVGLMPEAGTTVERVALRLVQGMRRATGLSGSRFAIEVTDEANLIIRVDDRSIPVLPSTDEEAYTLNVDGRRAELHARTVLGLSRAIETFLQLMQPTEDGFSVPAVRIEDRPRFRWRGLLLDAVRRWLPPSVIERNLEAMAATKLNVLHWHVTDDQAFRIESRRFPRLHQMGSAGLFYTQDDVRRIVDFAADRGIRVVPEFDMPGHAGSWFVGHPELASAPGPYHLPREYGRQTPTMDPTRPEVYDFISAFLEEMTGLFPDPFVHIGGDEIDPAQWLGSPEIRDFMASADMDGPRELHAYFNRRIHSILRELDRELVGWDPILHESLPAGSVVQSVRGQQWLAQSVRRGFRAIEGSEYYLTQMRPAGYHYSRDPCDADDVALTPEEQQRVLGGEVSIWTEVASDENIDSRTWPRAAAVAERLWSDRATVDEADMYRRLAVVDRRLELTGLTHRTGPRLMRNRLTGDRSVEALHAFAAVVRPVSSTIRKGTRSYMVDTPLNRLVDATPPESEEARNFELEVVAFVSNPTDADAYEILSTQLQTWIDLRDRLRPEIERYPLLSEVEPLVGELSAVAGIGLRSLTALHGGLSVPSTDREAYLARLRDAERPVAELELAICPAVEQLVRAT